ncbi:hypothetical protein JCM4814A_16010 [Streptomyces phaeofaciens JCM 4814]
MGSEDEAHMCKRMLRSVLAVAFSAGLVFGAVGTQDLWWDSVPADAGAANTQAAPAPDLHWDVIGAGSNS